MMTIDTQTIVTFWILSDDEGLLSVVVVLVLVTSCWVGRISVVVTGKGLVFVVMVVLVFIAEVVIRGCWVDSNPFVVDGKDVVYVVLVVVVVVVLAEKHVECTLDKIPLLLVIKDWGLEKET